MEGVPGQDAFVKILEAEKGLFSKQKIHLPALERQRQWEARTIELESAFQTNAKSESAFQRATAVDASNKSSHNADVCMRASSNYQGFTPTIRARKTSAEAQKGRQRRQDFTSSCEPDGLVSPVLLADPPVYVSAPSPLY